MTHAQTENRCPSTDNDQAARAMAAGKPDLPGTKWRRALAALAEAPLRLHRYRNLHSEVVEDAIRAYDCRFRCGDDS